MQGPNWNKLSDFHLKTTIMAVLKDDQKWLEKHIEEVFRRSIEKLYECITTACLPHFHDEDLNLFDDIDNNDLEAVKTRMDEIVIDIRNNSPLTVKKYFLIEECCTTTIDGKDPPPPSSCNLM
uniref:Mab-21-like HhH/H2TH-like domain-containing protein n=1 Tax=Clytia hemisphaerica TaxID=252671 RepID=A0A7M5X089_9CNID